MRSGGGRQTIRNKAVNVSNATWGSAQWTQDSHKVEGAEHRVAQAGPGRPPEKEGGEDCRRCRSGQEALRGGSVSRGGDIMCKGPEVRARRPAGLSEAGALEVAQRSRGDGLLHGQGEECSE